MRIEKEKDKINIKTENKILVVVDLENIITLPKADVGLFFYNRKLTMYNLTAHQHHLSSVTTLYGQKLLLEGDFHPEESSGRSSQHNRHVLVRQLHSAKFQLSYFTSHNRISFF